MFLLKVPIACMIPDINFCVERVSGRGVKNEKVSQAGDPTSAPNWRGKKVLVVGSDVEGLSHSQKNSRLRRLVLEMLC